MFGIYNTKVENNVYSAMFHNHNVEQRNEHLHILPNRVIEPLKADRTLSPSAVKYDTTLSLKSIIPLYDDQTM